MPNQPVWQDYLSTAVLWWLWKGRDIYNIRTCGSAGLFPVNHVGGAETEMAGAIPRMGDGDLPINQPKPKKGGRECTKTTMVLSISEPTWTQTRVTWLVHFGEVCVTLEVPGLHHRWCMVVSDPVFFCHCSPQRPLECATILKVGGGGGEACGLKSLRLNLTFNQPECSHVATADCSDAAGERGGRKMCVMEQANGEMGGNNAGLLADLPLCVPVWVYGHCLKGENKIVLYCLTSLPSKYSFPPHNYPFWETLAFIQRGSAQSAAQGQD